MKTKSFSIELSDDAEDDFNKSYEYYHYHEDNPKVADALYISINHCFEIIKQNPNTFPIAYKNVRKYVIKKFPFVVYYRIVDEVIQVIAIFHTSRNPETWNERT